MYIGEEDTAAQGKAPELTDEPTWMIDPIDGALTLTLTYTYAGLSLA